MHIRTNGMDGVFFARKNMTTNIYTDLLSEWNNFSNEEIDKWLEDEKVNFDKFDRENLRMSGEYLRLSLKGDMWRALEPILQGRFEGPRILVAVIRQHQIPGPSAVRDLVTEIQGMSIQQEPGEDVTVLARKIYRICKKITGMVRSVPEDLAEICASCFLETKTLAFNIEAVRMHKQARDGELTWDDVLSKVQNEYLALATGSKSKWVALRDKKEDPMIKAMQAKIDKQESELKQVKTQLQRKDSSGGNNTNSSGGDKSKHSNITCRICKEKGHIARNCPQKGSNKSDGGRKKNDNNKKSNSPDRQAPKDNEPHVKTMDGEENAWCERCKRWTKGEKKHVTAQHKTREELKGSAAPPSQANYASHHLPDDDDDGYGGALGLMSGFR